MLLRAGWVMYTSFSPSGSSFCILWSGICIGGILLRRSSFDFHMVVEDGLVTKSRPSIWYLPEKDTHIDHGLFKKSPGVEENLHTPEI